MIYQCYQCNCYNFRPACIKCGGIDNNIPLNPEYYPEFEYRSKGLISDMFFKKKEQKIINSKLDSVLSKYNRLKNPYFINYFYLSAQNNSTDKQKSMTFNDLILFKQVLLNLGFDELEEYSGLLEKLIRSTEFEFKYDSFLNKTRHPS